MNNIKFKKEKISIQNIGKKRFWFGIISGLISATTIALIFNRIREIIRLLTSLYQDLLFFEENELIFFNYFFVSLATVLGLSITIWVWMGNPINKRKKHNLFKQQARTYTLSFFWLVMFLLAQLSCLFIYFSVSEVNGYDLPINLYTENKLIFILIPIVIFIQNWFIVRRIYKTKKWIFKSLFISVITIFTLYKTTTIDQEILNNIYLKRYEVLYKYIKNTISKSKEKYGIKFNEQAIKTLEQRKTYNSFQQISNIKQSFANKKKVSLDTIIIQRIIIHNLKARDTYRYGDSLTLVNWKYALPKDIFKQIKYFKNNSNETNELFKTLKEVILLVNRSKIVFDGYRDFEETITEKDRLELKVNVMLVKQLIQVRDSLINLETYSELNKILPKIKNVP